MSTPVTAKQLAEQRRVATYIEKGLAGRQVEESRSNYLRGPVLENSGKHCGCALGIAMVGKFGDAEKAHAAFWKNNCHVAATLKIDYWLAQAISDTHFATKRSARWIAKELRKKKEFVYK